MKKIAIILPLMSTIYAWSSPSNSTEDARKDGYGKGATLSLARTAFHEEVLRVGTRDNYVKEASLEELEARAIEESLRTAKEEEELRETKSRALRDYKEVQLKSLQEEIDLVSTSILSLWQEERTLMTSQIDHISDPDDKIRKEIEEKLAINRAQVRSLGEEERRLNDRRFTLISELTTPRVTPLSLLPTAAEDANPFVRSFSASSSSSQSSGSEGLDLPVMSPFLSSPPSLLPRVDGGAASRILASHASSVSAASLRGDGSASRVLAVPASSISAASLREDAARSPLSALSSPASSAYSHQQEGNDGLSHSPPSIPSWTLPFFSLFPEDKK